MPDPRSMTVPQLAKWMVGRDPEQVRPVLAAMPRHRKAELVKHLRRLARSIGVSEQEISDEMDALTGAATPIDPYG